MELDWVATDPETGRLSSVRRITAEEYVAWVAVLHELGEGYTEVSLAARPYPCLAFGFRGGYGVVHQFAAEGDVFLLSGDDTVDEGHTVVVPTSDVDDAEWASAFVLDADHAWTVVTEFVRNGSVEGLGRWEEL